MMRMKKLSNLRKKILILILVTIIGGIFQGCACVQYKNPEMPEVIANIQKVTDLSPMGKGNKSKLRKFYSISTKGLENFASYNSEDKYGGKSNSHIKGRKPR